MLIEMHTQYTPFFTHYHQQIVNLRDQYGQTNLNFQKSLLTKIYKMLHEKIEEIQNDVLIEKYGLPSRECLTHLV